MMQFWIAALALGLVAAAFVLVPVVRAWARHGTEGKERSSTALGVGIVVAFAIPVVATMLYTRWSTWDWSSGNLRMAGADAAAIHEMDQVIGLLEERLRLQPNDVQGWTLLGRSYMSMRRFADAGQAFRQAAALDGHASPDVLADFGEALALSDPEGLQGEAGAIFERVLAMDPAHPKALWYGGLNAFENANWALADRRLSQLLTLNPPATLIPLLEDRIAAARAHGGEMGAQAEGSAQAEVVARPPTVAEERARPQPAPQAETEAPTYEAQVTAQAPANAGDGIQLEISLDPALAARLSGPTPMFIIARNAGGGPPLAVIRANSSELPMSVQLTDANAMMEGVTITDQEALELVVRVSMSGSPAERPGDLFGAVNYARGNHGPARIRIDRIAE
jgi:cytochrome c-type biogenesis protein CcmH